MTVMLPLLRRYAPGVALACAGESVSPRHFIATARRLAATLPEAQAIVNLCEDRYHFLLAFAAALIAGRLTLTPASRAVAAIARARSEFPDSHIVSDHELADLLNQLAHSTDGLGGADESEDFSIPEIAADHEAIVLFTSGSSGQPTAHRKTWGMLVQGAEQLQHAFGIAPGSFVLGTIPPQHMFGLESTIVFPLQWGCTIHRQRPLLPADIRHAAAAGAVDASVWLMTTPLHLRACVSDGVALAGVSGAISATMPLDHAGARAAEAILAGPLYEIYGCTEAGITATRRPTLDMEWQLCPDFRMRIEAGQCLLEGERVVAALALADLVEMNGADRFALLGRAGDMIKIAGKRTSLAALNAELSAIDGVVDGCFYNPDNGASGASGQRLAAFVVAPGLSAAAILDALRRRIDPVFLPRPLRKVAQLPRDANGKLPRAALQSLALEGERPKTPLQRTALVASDHAALDGHFPGNPIVPGVLLLNQTIALARHSHRVVGVRQVKFHAPLRPGQAYRISIDQTTPELLKFTIDLASEGEPLTIASGSLSCEPAAPCEA